MPRFRRVPPVWLVVAVLAMPTAIEYGLIAALISVV